MKSKHLIGVIAALTLIGSSSAANAQASSAAQARASAAQARAAVAAVVPADSTLEGDDEYGVNILALGLSWLAVAAAAAAVVAVTVAATGVLSDPTSP